MECHEISRILGSKALTKIDSKLGLIFGLRLMKEHFIAHRDACSLSSLKVRGTLDILRAKVFLQKDLYGKP